MKNITIGLLILAVVVLAASIKINSDRITENELNLIAFAHVLGSIIYDPDAKGYVY